MKFFCKTMLPHQGYSRPENPKMHRIDSSIKFSPLQNYGIMNLQNHGLKDKFQRNSEMGAHSSITPKKVEMELTMCSFYSTVQRDRTYCSTQLFARLSRETSGLNLVAHLVGLSTCHIAASTHTAPLSVPFR